MMMEMMEMMEMMVMKMRKKMSLISLRTLVLRNRARSKRHQRHQERNHARLHLSMTLVPSTDHQGLLLLHFRHTKPRQPRKRLKKRPHLLPLKRRSRLER
jgi:hypothetical protein